MALTGKQRRQLRALGHHLSAVVQVGQQGVTEGVIGAVAQALEDHELIKVKVSGDAPEDRHEASEALAKATGAEIAQVLGRTVLLFKKRKLKSKFENFDKLAAPKPANKRNAPKPGAKKKAARKVADDEDEEDDEERDDLEDE